jgi:hypothetical protein
MHTCEPRAPRATNIKINYNIVIMHNNTRDAGALVLEKTQSAIIWYFSWLCFFTSLYALYRGYNDFFVCTGGVFLTYINYWRKPDLSVRRYFDIAYTTSAISYQLYHAQWAQNGRFYWFFMSIGITSFVVGVWYYKRGKWWYSTWFHCGLHFFGNVANVFLYSGAREACVAANINIL